MQIKKREKNNNQEVIIKVIQLIKILMKVSTVKPNKTGTQYTNYTGMV